MWTKRTRKRGLTPNCKGFTLIEVVVSLALAGIFFTAALSLVAPLYQENRRIYESAEGQQLAGSLLDEMRLSAASSGSVYAGTKDGSGEVHIGKTGARNDYTVKDGQLFLNGTPVFSGEYYDGRTIELQCESVAENLIKATITVKTKERTLCKVSGLVGSLRRVLDLGNGLIFCDPAPNAKLQAALDALIGWNKGEIDSTAIPPNDEFAAQMRTYLEAHGDLNAYNIRSWAVRREGNYTITWWTDQNITVYQADDWVRVIRYNSKPEMKTYTPGWMRLKEKTTDNGKSFMILAGGVQNADWKEYKPNSIALTNDEKRDYAKIVDAFNSMSVMKP